MAIVLYDGMNAREQLEACAEWLGWQHEDMSYGLTDPEHGLKLWRYMKAHDELSDMADEWAEEDRVKAIGYCPLSNYYANEAALAA